MTDFLTTVAALSESPLPRFLVAVGLLLAAVRVWVWFSEAWLQRHIDMALAAEYDLGPDLYDREA